MIVVAELTDVAPDVGHLPAAAAEVRALRDVAVLADEHPTTLSADAGYLSGENAAQDGAGLDDPAPQAGPAPEPGKVYAIDRFGSASQTLADAMPAARPLSTRSSGRSRMRAGSPPSVCAASSSPPARTSWPASPTTLPNCSASARSPRPTAPQ